MSLRRPATDPPGPCYFEPDPSEHREAVGGDAAAGASRALDGTERSDEDQLARDDAGGKESWYVGYSAFANFLVGQTP